MTWTNIDNALVSVGALPFATTMQALRDNPAAIANGDSGAPAVLMRSWETSAAGGTIKAREDAEISATGTLLTGSAFCFLHHGVVRASCDARLDGSAGTTVARLYRRRAGGDTPLYQSGGLGGSYVTLQVDLNIIPGDWFFWQVATITVPFTGTLYLRNQRALNNGADLPVFRSSAMFYAENVRSALR